jgi:GntR family transcriptional repressor for pyruvate dehydrogenase complex
MQPTNAVRDPFQKLDRQRLSQLVADQVEEAILGGRFAVGTRLPAEQALAEQFGVSRNVVREALKIVQERGLVEIVNGSGAFVAAPDHGAASDALARYLRQSGANGSLESITALYEVRKIIEGETARLAAKRRNANDLVVMGDCLEQMAQHAGLLEQWAEADLAFHICVARATHNQFLVVILEPLMNQLRQVIAEGYLAPGATDTGLKAHFSLFNTIKKRDAKAAHTAMVTHLRDSEQRVKTVMSKGGSRS